MDGGGREIEQSKPPQARPQDKIPPEAR